jgi:IclR family transcriptional regulator, pca regulon regulatory protein
MSSVGRRAQTQSLERGLSILSAFRPEDPLLGISELARMLDLNRSTVHRYVATLHRLGYLQQDPATRRYRLGMRVLDLGFSAINSMELREIAQPHLQELSDKTGHTVNMAILDHSDIVYIDRVRSPRPGQNQIDLNLHVGSRLPAYCTSMGKVMLAYLPEPALGDVLDHTELIQRGPNTMTDRKGLIAELHRIRLSGLAVNNEELAYGLRSIAVAIRTPAGESVAAVNLAVHRSMVSMDDLIARLGPSLRSTAEEISRRIGHRPPTR